MAYSEEVYWLNTDLKKSEHEVSENTLKNEKNTIFNLNVDRDRTELSGGKIKEYYCGDDEIYNFS